MPMAIVCLLLVIAMGIFILYENRGAIHFL